MTRRRLTPLIVLVCSLCGCKDVGSFIEPVDFIELRLLTISLYANLEPPAPSDPIVCRALVLMQNTSTTRSVTGLSIPEGEVILDSSGQLLGKISFSSDWDGHLDPLEQDTIRLEKNPSHVALFDPPCSTYVQLVVAVKKDLSVLKKASSGRFLFICAH